MKPHRLDSPGGHLYKAPPRRWWGAAWALALLVGVTARADVVGGGVQLPEGAEKVGENRYRVPGDFEAAQKYYKTVYPSGQYPRKSIVNQPGIKAVHISNPSGKKWEGINIYQANDEVRIFVIVAPEPKAAPVQKKEGKGKK